MSAQHTPGPWEYVTGPSLKGRYHSVHAADEYMVCECWDGDDEGQQEADARLIAATPELLEALEDVLEADRRRYDNTPEAQEFFRQNNAKYLNLIAKARGVQA